MPSICGKICATWPAPTVTIWVEPPPSSVTIASLVSCGLLTTIANGDPCASRMHTDLLWHV